MARQWPGYCSNPCPSFTLQNSSNRGERHGEGSVEQLVFQGLGANHHENGAFGKGVLPGRAPSTQRLSALLGKKEDLYLGVVEIGASGISRELQLFFFVYPLQKRRVISGHPVRFASDQSSHFCLIWPLDGPSPYEEAFRVQALNEFF